MKLKFLAAVSSLLLLVGFTTPAAAANEPALVPTFGTAESVAGGFAVPITNWSADYTWRAIASDCAVATVANGWLTVTGVLSNQTVTARVFTERAGYDSGSAVFSSSAAGFISANYVSDAGQSSWVSSLQADSSGNIYAIWNAFLADKVVVKKSSDQGRSWTVVKEWTAAGSSTPVLAVGSNGRMAAVWRSGAEPSYEILGSVSTDAGLTWSAPVTITPAGLHARLAVGISADGDVIVAWDRDEGSYQFSVHSSVSQDSGLNWSTSTQRSLGSESSLYPQVQKTSAGSLVLLWEGSPGPRASNYDETTGLFGTQIGIDSTRFVGGSLRADNGANSKIWATWLSGYDGSRHVVVANFDGAAWTLAPALTSSTGYYYDAQILATDTHLSVIYQSGSTLIYGHSSASQSTVSWGAQKIISGFGTNLQNPRITSSPLGPWIVSFNRVNPSTNNLRPTYVLSSDFGSTWGTPVPYASSNFQNYLGQAVVDSTGAIVLVWHEQAPNARIRAAAITSTVLSPDSRELYQIAEINPGVAHASIYDIESLNGKLYLIASNVETGRELFELANGEVNLVQDLYPGTGNGLYDQSFVANTGTALYFNATNGVTGYELYKFDGTTISLVADIDPDTANLASAESQVSAGSMPAPDGRAVVLDNKLFFEASHPNSGTGYVINLTGASTPVTFANHFSNWNLEGFQSPVVLGSKLYFIASGASGSAIYETDGTAVPTVVAGTAGTNPLFLAGLGTKLVYTGTPVGSNTGLELMTWDSASPTVAASLAANINTTAGTGSFPTQFAVRCNELYFAASSGFDDQFANRELWKWDGFGASLAKDFYPGAAASDSGNPQSIHIAGNEILTFAQTSTFGFEPWILKGSEASMIQDFRAGPADSISGAPPMLTVGGQTYTPLWGATGLELYAYGVKPAGHQVATFAMEYTITYDSNGGTGSATLTQEAGSVTLSSGTGFSKTGKVLAGWDTSDTAIIPTYSLGSSYSLSANVTLYAVWEDEPVVPPVDNTTNNPSDPGNPTDNSTDQDSTITQEPVAAPLPTITTPPGGAEATSGGDLELKGSGFSAVTQAEIDAKNAEIKQKTDTSLKLGLPELNTGTYDLTLKTISGQLTLQDAVRIVNDKPFVTPEALSKFAAWTKLNSSRTKVQVLAKNPVGVGKVQFFHNGKEVAWVRAVDESDPKLTSAPVASYLVRKVGLLPGKNRFEIRVSGERRWQATYSLKG